MYKTYRPNVLKDFKKLYWVSYDTSIQEMTRDYD